MIGKELTLMVDGFDSPGAKLCIFCWFMNNYSNPIPARILIMIELTQEDIALLKEPQLAHLATIDSDGSPHVTPVWVDTDGNNIVINTAKGRVKYRNIERDPRVSVSVVDKANDYRTLWIKGTAKFETEGADDHINAMAKKYLDQDTYPFRKPGEVRVKVLIEPTAKLGV